MQASDALASTDPARAAEQVTRLIESAAEACGAPTV
jgi:hypothetical protein